MGVAWGLSGFVAGALIGPIGVRGTLFVAAAVGTSVALVAAGVRRLSPAAAAVAGRGQAR